ncbi:MAG: patatin-like phospholipase family protein, partial [Mesorhizobium sp.]
SCRAARMWRSRPGTIAEAMQGGIRVGQFNIERILKAFLPDAIPATFEELKIPLKVTATDYFGHKLAVFSQGDLQSALAASAAIPAVFRPVMRDDRLLIDGGIYNPVPFDLVEKDADIIIAIDVVGAPSDVERKHPTTVDLMYGATQLMMQSIIANKLRQHPPNILIRPAVSKYRVLDFLKIETLMADTVEIKDELKRAVEKAVAERGGKLGKAV